MILFAGLFETWHPEPDADEITFTIITTDANALIAPVHDRMPVILPEEAVDDWLFPGNANVETLKALLHPPPEDLLLSTPASPRVNSVKNEGPELLETSR